MRPSKLSEDYQKSGGQLGPPDSQNLLACCEYCLGRRLDEFTVLNCSLTKIEVAYCANTHRNRRIIFVSVMGSANWLVGFLPCQSHDHLHFLRPKTTDHRAYKSNRTLQKFVLRPGRTAQKPYVGYFASHSPPIG